MAATAINSTLNDIGHGAPVIVMVFGVLLALLLTEISRGNRDRAAVTATGAPVVPTPVILPAIRPVARPAVTFASEAKPASKPKLRISIRADIVRRPDPAPEPRKLYSQDGTVLTPVARKPA